MPKTFTELFTRPKPVIAMIHTGPSPGVPGFVCVESVVERAIAETEAFVAAGVDGIIVENMRDFPCVHEDKQGPEVAAIMTRVSCAVKRRASMIPVGIQVLFQANRTALAVGLQSGKSTHLVVPVRTGLILCNSCVAFFCRSVTRLVTI